MKIMINRKKQRGLSMIELMVALTIGLFLLLGLTSVYVVASRSDKQNQVVTVTDEVARQLFRRLAFDFEQAGYVDPFGSPVEAFKESGGSCNNDNTNNYANGIGDLSDEEVKNAYLRRVTTGGDARKLNPIGKISCGNMQPVFGCGGDMDGDLSINQRASCDNDADNDTKQSIQISYQIANPSGTTESYSSLPKASEGNYVDCTGRSINNNPNKQNGFAINRYYLSDDNKESSFVCVGNGNASSKTTIVQGVEEMMFRYLVTSTEEDDSAEIEDTDSGRVVSGYQTAAQMLNSANTIGWSSVVGVEVCVVISAPLVDGRTADTLASAQGDSRPTCRRESNGVFSGNVSKGDKRNRFFKRYTRIFNIPNAIFVTSENNL